MAAEEGVEHLATGGDTGVELTLLVTQELLGIPRSDGGEVETDSRRIWMMFAENYHLIRGTPTRLWFDHALHTQNRYYVRTVVFFVAPLLGGLAVLHSLIDFSLQIPGVAIIVLALVGAGLAQSFRTARPSA